MAFRFPLPVVARRDQPLKATNKSTIPGLPEFDKRAIKSLILIGMGSFGKVYKGEMFNETVVLKEFAARDASPRDLKLFEKEARILNCVRGHENIVEI